MVKIPYPAVKYNREPGFKTCRVPDRSEYIAYTKPLEKKNIIDATKLRDLPTNE